MLVRNAPAVTLTVVERAQVAPAARHEIFDHSSDRSLIRPLGLNWWHWSWFWLRDYGSAQDAGWAASPRGKDYGISALREGS
jgi:hypothetical protein